MRRHTQGPTAASTTHRRFVGLIAIAIAIVTLALGATAASAEAPTVSIDPPSETAYTTVKASGEVDPKDQGAWWSFETCAGDVAACSAPGAPWSGFGFQGFIESSEGKQPVSIELGGLQPATEYQLRLVANNFVDSEVASTVESFTTLPVAQPTVSLDPISAITATSAHFEGQIDPNAPEAAPVSDPKVEEAFKVTYRFDCTPACPDTPDPQVVPAGDQPQTVSFDPTGLVPNTDYTVKLIGSNAGGEVVAEQSFKTDFSAPQVKTGGAFEVEPTSAVIAGRVNPYGQATSYRFEYGTDASYGSFSPAAPVAIGSGHTHLTLTRKLTGLQAGTTYHYRLLATNATGTSEGEDRTFTTPATAEPGWGYELVSPLNKAGGQVSFPGGVLGSSFFGINMASPDGNAVTYVSISSFADPDTGLPASYKSTRGPSGWETSNLSPASNVAQPGLVSGHSYLWGASENLEVGFTWTNNNYDPQDQDQNSGVGVGGKDVYELREGHAPKWLSRPNGGGPDAETVFQEEADSRFSANSPDGSGVLFTSRSGTLSPSPMVGGWHLYMRKAGKTTMVDVDTGGNPISSCGADLGGGYVGVISLSYLPDMSRIAFTAPARDNFSSDPACQQPRQLYLRAGDQTIHVSASQRSEPDPAGTQEARFGAMSPNGDRVFFMSSEALTDDAPVEAVESLYAYDVSSQELTLLNVSPVNNIVQVSADGDRVFYEAESNGLSARLFMYEDGEGRQEVAQIGSDFGPAPNLARISKDGEKLLFRATTDPTNETGEPQLGQIYLYDAAADDLQCLSCQVVDGPMGEANLGGDISSGGVPRVFPGVRAFSADGNQAVFNSGSRLVPADRNGKPDVYRWSGGELHLVSDGKDEFGSFLMDASADGRSVFFTTGAALIGADRDGAMDLYVARAGGGFPEPLAPPSCQGATCKAAAPPPPLEDALGTNLSAAGHGYRCEALMLRASRLRAKARQSQTQNVKRLRKKANRAAKRARQCQIQARGNS